ncbi:MAG: HAMP domain-containing sensor histidine kinase [Gemmatimonadales bacterium]|jgi:signal transduction histidine kinase
MQTIRGRLAVWYAVAMAVALAVFAAVVYWQQRAVSLAELDERVRLEADLIATVLTEAHREGTDLVVPDSSTGQPTLEPGISQLLQGVPGFVVVLLRHGQGVFISAEARTVSVPAFSRLFAVVEESSGRGDFGLIDMGEPFGEVRYYGRPLREAGPELAGVVAAIPTAGLQAGPERVLSIMLLTGVVLIGGSTLTGYWLAGRALEPVDDIVDEVEAISDGRSLHRRLAAPRAHEEMARLTTTLNAMLSRLERSFATLRRFTADASHELKTPLTVLRSGIEHSITHPDVPQDVLEVLEEILFEVNRMSEMVDSLLTLARADEGRAPLHLDDVDLREVLAEVAETASILGEHAGVDVAVEVPDLPVPMRADRGRLRQLFMNLLTNAIKYTPPGGSVWIESVETTNEVVVRVRDAGIGIAPGDLPHIFERFWRADPARSRTGSRPGAGLGLAICRWTAEAHGGSIEVTSRPGRGTNFTVTLPRGVEVTGDDHAEAGR